MEQCLTSLTGLSSTQYEQIPIILGVWPFWLTPIFFSAQSYNLDINSYDDSNASKQLIKSTVAEKYTFEWLAKLQDLTTNPILRTYNLFKKEFRWKNYLSCVQSPQYRNALTKFRTSSHTLEIERGRHTNPITPVEQRLCNVCHV